MNEDILVARQKLDEARKNYAAGKFYNAGALCRQALNLVRFHSNSEAAKEIYFTLGLIHLELGTSYSEWDLNDSLLACKFFNKVIALDENFAAAYLYRGLAILAWGNNYGMALADFDKVLELEPNIKLAEKFRATQQKYFGA